MMEQGFLKRYILPVTAALVLFLAIILLTYRGTRRMIAAHQVSVSSYNDLVDLTGTLGLLRDAETGQRGYILTGDARYLAPYDRALSQLPHHRQRIDQILGPGEREPIQQLIDREVAYLAGTIAVYREQGTAAARDLIAGGRGKAIMDSLRFAFDQVIDGRHERLAELAARDRSLARGALVAITALSLIGLIGLVSFILSLLRNARERRRMYLALHLERDQLEHRVRDRTGELERERARSQVEARRAQAAADRAEHAAERMGNALRERLAAEQARLASEAQHRILVEQVRDYAIFALDLEGRATSWNEGVRRVLGFEEEEFIGIEPEAIFTPEAAEAGIPDRELREAVQHGSASNDRWMQRKDGTRFYANGVTTAVRDAEGSLLGFTKVMRDQTANKLIEDALRKSETKYRMVARASREAIWEWDLANGRLEWNEGVERLFQYPVAEVPPRIEWWESNLHPEDRNRVLAGIRTAVGGSDEYWNDEYRFRRADGQYAEVSHRGLIDRDPAGHARRMIGTLADITERRRTQEKLSEAQRMESVGRLAGGVAHDLNNMLTAIVGYSSFLLEDLPADSPTRTDLTEILRAAERSAALTRSLLVFARREIIQPAPVDVNQLVLGMLRMITSAIGESIRVTLRLDAGPAIVLADRSRLEQVILNLALNARDAMFQGGDLTITSDTLTLDSDSEIRHPGTEIPPGPYVRVSVIDTGQGMDRTTLARVFEPFFTTKGVGEGTGLGLSTAYGTIKQAGGFIWAYSEPGYGSTFNIYLPVHGTEAVAGPERADMVPARGGQESILVVEDEDTVRNLTRRILSAEGYGVLDAPDGETGLDLLQSRPEPVQLILTDLIMPGMGGRELADRIHERWADIPVIYSSGFTDDEVIRRGLMERGQPFLQKPWSPRELLSKVRETLDQHETASSRRSKE